jgi:hypothetical protein
MEKQQRTRPPGRPAAQRNAIRPERRPVTPPARPYAKSRPYQPPQRKAPPPPYIPAAKPGRYPSLAAARGKPKPQIITKAKLADMTFREALYPEARDTPAQRRAAFLLSLLYALIYAACSFALIHPLNVLTARMAFPIADIIRASLPAFVGAALCALTRLRFPDDPRILLLAHRRLLRETLFVFIALQALLWGEWDAQRLLALFVLRFAAGPLIIGTGVSVLLLYLDWLYIDVDE